MFDGHRRTNGPPSLHARDFATMTGVVTHCFERTGEPRPRLEFRRSAGPLSAGYDRTSTSAFRCVARIQATTLLSLRLLSFGKFLDRFRYKRRR